MMDYLQLEAVAAVIRYGSFERAAKVLNITPSAVSQRVKVLEEKMGAVLIARGQPCRATLLGARLFRHAEDVGLLEQALRRDVETAVGTAQKATLGVAVNADSLATWFSRSLVTTTDLLFHITCEDQEHTAELLKSGQVSAAVSSSGVEVPGCRCRRLGSMRYRAVATPQYISYWFADGVTAATLADAPGLLFNNKDNLIERWFKESVGEPVSPPAHWLPSTHAILSGTLDGLGWGINPENLVKKHIEDGILKELIPHRPLDVPLYWHWSKAAEAAITLLTASVREVAQIWLV